MTVLLALSGAICYGLSDFVGGLSSRRSSAWSVAFLAALTGAVLVLAASVAGAGDPGRADLVWGAAAGVGNGIGTAFLYRGFARGRMGVVAPLSAVGAALVPVAVGVASGERPAALVWLGIVLAVPGIWLVSQEDPGPGGGTATGRPGAAGTVDGVLAGLGFGSLFAALGQVPDGAGLLPLAVNQLVAALVILAAALALGGTWLPRQPAAWWGLLCGALGAAATVAFLLATHRGSLTVAAILASLYPAITIVLASTVLRERVHAGQAVGLACCATTVLLVAVA